MGEIEREKKNRETGDVEREESYGRVEEFSEGCDCTNFEFISLVFEVYIFLSYSEN